MPGVYELPRNHRRNPFSVAQALSHAGGPNRTAQMKNGRILRLGSEGPRKDLEVDFKKVMLGQAEDLPVRPYDVLFVPSSTFKNIGYAMVGIVPGTISATVINSTR
jgi:protein involved in polysaccharide export with SLBB domain